MRCEGPANDDRRMDNMMNEVAHCDWQQGKAQNKGLYVQRAIKIIIRQLNDGKKLSYEVPCRRIYSIHPRRLL